MPIAVTRPLSDAIVRCELTHVAREPIDVATARAQHAAYEAALADLGCRIVRLPEAPDLPDAVFVEDTAIVLEEAAIMTHPGAPSRRPECESAAAVLGGYRQLLWIQPPATLDGGDVLVLGRSVLVGLSGRTNAAGVEQLRGIAEPFGYEVSGVEVRGCLHLKSAVTAIADDAVLLNPEWLDAGPFGSRERVEVDPAEPRAANVLRIGDGLLASSTFPRTLERMHQRGLDIHTVEMTELAKAEGAVTCCSIVFDS